jgi:hypothetical protein
MLQTPMAFTGPPAAMAFWSSPTSVIPNSVATARSVRPFLDIVLCDSRACPRQRNDDQRDDLAHDLCSEASLSWDFPTCTPALAVDPISLIDPLGIY